MFLADRVQQLFRFVPGNIANGRDAANARSDLAVSTTNRDLVSGFY
jgi:hypothetical protein